MSTPLMLLAAHGLALALTLLSMVAALSAFLTRSLVSMVMFLAVSAVAGGCAVLALGAGDAALAWVLTGFGLAPVVLLAVMLLSARVAKARRAPPVFAIAAALCAGAAMLWATADVGGTAPMTAPSGALAPWLAPWLAPLVFVGVAMCVGLLGYGERGALQRRSGGDE